LILVAFVATAGLGSGAMEKMGLRSAMNPHPESAESVSEGATIYAGECASCHDAGGFGDGLAGKKLVIPPTNLRAFIAERTEGYFLSQVAYGKTGNPEMPVFAETLSIDQIWHVTNFVYSLRPVPKPAASLRSKASSEKSS
jgi:mono/diheme cytochrome c family protein